jgi:hypothetical protein
MHLLVVRMRKFKKQAIEYSFQVLLFIIGWIFGCGIYFISALLFFLLWPLTDKVFSDSALSGNAFSCKQESPYYLGRVRFHQRRREPKCFMSLPQKGWLAWSNENPALSSRGERPVHFL